MIESSKPSIFVSNASFVTSIPLLTTPFVFKVKVLVGDQGASPLELYLNE